MATRSYMSIGEILVTLKTEFSDITGRETGSAARMSTQFRFLLRELSDRKDHPVHLPKWEHPRWRR